MTKKTVEVGEARTIELDDLTAIQHLAGNPVAQARIAERLMEKHKDQAEVAKIMGVRQPWVSKLLRLLELPESILSKVEEGKMSATTAYLLTRLPSKDRAKLAQVEDLVQKDVQAAVRKAQVTDEVLNLIEAPAPKDGAKCPHCGRAY